MLVGISAPQLMAIFSFIERGEKRRGNNFLNVLQLAKFAMEMTPKKGNLFYFQKQSKGSLDGQELFRILMAYHQLNTPLYVLTDVPPIINVSEPNATEQEGTKGREEESGDSSEDKGSKVAKLSGSEAAEAWRKMFGASADRDGHAGERVTREESK